MLAECLQREAKMLCQIDHPHVARLLNQINDEHGSFLVLEYIAGPTLEQHLTRPGALGTSIPGAALPPGAALAYGHGISQTLCYLASLPQPVVHCDIKPANLILPPGQRIPTLVDFGGAVLQQGGALETTRLTRYGTPGYAAPEQYGGISTPKSDVYGLAATLYHLLSRKPPHHAATADAMMKAAVNAPPPPIVELVPGVPPELSTIIDKALAHDPDTRYQNARELAEDLNRFVTGQMVASHHYTPGEKLKRFVKKHKVPVAAVSIAAGDISTDQANPGERSASSPDADGRR